MVWRTALRLLLDVVRFVSFGFRSRSQLVAENPFLRKQLALYRERQVKPHRADDAMRITLVMLSRLIDWRAVLTIVKPDTLIRWHRKGFRLSWRWKSRPPGRPPLSADVQRLIANSGSAAAGPRPIRSADGHVVGTFAVLSRRGLQDGDGQHRPGVLKLLHNETSR